MCGGRASGKTHTGSETLAGWTQAHRGRDWGIVAPVFATARDVCVEGPSGLLRALDRAGQPYEWNRSMGQVMLADGGRVFIDGADDGAGSLQGKNLSGVWADECGLWSRHQWRMAWHESVRLSVRVAPGRIVATGTPKRGHPLVRMLLKDPGIAVTRMRTRDNAENLDAASLAELETRYGGTTLARQELEGEWLDEIEGALWTIALLDRTRVLTAPATLPRICVAIDPAVTATVDSDRTGIVVVGKGSDGHAYVLADLSGRHSPHIWARRAVQAYHDFKADRIIAEGNQGGDLVSHMLRLVDPNVPVTIVNATRGKAVRAEPILMLWEQGKAHLVGTLPDLEDELVSWVPGEGASPDRLDAMVWGCTWLMLSSGGPHVYVG